ncbi:MAG: hypothetical protein AB9917_09635 [Negativicutes bacterium]
MMKLRNVVAGITVAGLALFFVSHSLGTNRNSMENVVIQNANRDKKIVMSVPANRTIEVGFIHSLYGGRQAERFLIGPDRVLNLQQVKFEVYDALLYYTGGSHARESREGGFWLIPSEYRTDSINYIIPQRQRNFFVRIGEQLHTAESLGEPADIIKIYVVKNP